MSIYQKRRAARQLRRRAHGQSIPLIAMMIVALFAMVGLSVDVGNSFSEERQVVAAANAASLSGMEYYIKNQDNVTNAQVLSQINAVVAANRVEIGEKLTLNASYLDEAGEVIAPITNDGQAPPSNVAYLRVEIKGVADTYFARVVGRNTLPIGASAYAGTCPPTDGIFPIAINSRYIRGDEFVTPTADEISQAGANSASDIYGTVSTPREYRGLTWRRIYPSSGTGNGQFGWMRWLDGTGTTGSNANSARELGAALSGTGTLGQGYVEAPWPENGALPRPAVYPEKPRELSVGDWVYGYSGNTNSNEARTALNDHIANGTRMILPIYDYTEGGGNDASYHIIKLGVFVLRAQSTNQSQGGWLEFIYLGDADRLSTACSVQPPTPGGNDAGLVGDVSFEPMYEQISKQAKPIQYVVVLDLSGSMSANFAGQCDRRNNGQTLSPPVQCTAGLSSTGQELSGTVSGTGTDYFWSVSEERRVYVAKQAVMRMVDLMNMPGNAKYDSTRPMDQMAFVWYTDRSSSSNVTTWSTTPATLKTAVQRANRTSSDDFRSNGGTNGAAGLFRAQQLLQAAPSSITFNNTKYDYKRVVVFVTDGVSNHFLWRNNPDGTLLGGESNRQTYPNGHSCRDNNIILPENATCQTSPFGSTFTHSSGEVFSRPITQMGEVSSDIQKLKAQVYAISLSNVPSTGLKESVASSPDYFFSVPRLQRYSDGSTNVDAIMKSIYEESKQGCAPMSDNEWRGNIPPSGAGSGTGLSYPTVGEVFLTSQSGSTYRAPIRAGTDGKLTYEFTGLQAGTYTLEAFVWYQHPNDPATRIYSKIVTSEDSANSISVTVDPNSSTSMTGVTRKNLQLKLFGTLCEENG